MKQPYKMVTDNDIKAIRSTLAKHRISPFGTLPQIVERMHKHDLPLPAHLPVAIAPVQQPWWRQLRSTASTALHHVAHHVLHHVLQHLTALIIGFIIARVWY